MCGIIAVVSRPPRRTPPARAALLGPLEAAAGALKGVDVDEAASRLGTAADLVADVDALLHGVPGLQCLLDEADLPAAIDGAAAEVEGAVSTVEAVLDAAGPALSGAALEAANAALLRLRDATWAIRRDRLRTAEAVADLAGPGAGPAAIAAFASVQIALSALDRLEVRGRDSAGLHLLVSGHGLDRGDERIAASIAARAADPRFTSGAVRTPDGLLSVVYKAAAEIGELGDNGRALRAAVRSDGLLRDALAAEGARVAVLCHTRWASVGIVSEANAHPLDSCELDMPCAAAPYVVAAANGDVDNHLVLRERQGLRIAPDITTDGKVIPTLVSRRIAEGGDTVDAFRGAAATFDGSVAIAASVASEPHRMLLALRGSGQGLFIGLAEDAFVVASEPYGLVEETSRYVRMDGESPQGHSGRPGQVIVVDGDAGGDLEGLRRFAYDSTELPVGQADVHVAEVTTRDIDRGEAPHYFLKEVAQAPSSVRNTLRGRIAERDGRPAVVLGEDTLPAHVRARLASGSIRTVYVIGQGTAAIAGRSVAAAVERAFAGDRSALPVLRAEAVPATELSGFRLADEMSDVLVIAISQSGTTTDTNRTVDLLRARGAVVISIVNRRGSDLVEKSDGVLYTSDGRDVEMSVASTKAFYAQIAAGFLLAQCLADAAGALDRARAGDLLDGLRVLPDAMEAVLERRELIALAAATHAPSRRYWSIVGNGANRIAAEEIRIKLSELCYKAIACDATEDKKHIDLSSEPLIVVCAAGLTGPNADDVAKEVAIFRAHKAAPIVFATEGPGIERFSSALATIPLPVVHPELGFVLSALAGHLFGYEAALAIDAGALPLREARAAVEAAVEGPPQALLERLAPGLAGPAGRFLEGVRVGVYDGHLQASTTLLIASLLRYATNLLPLEAYEIDFGVLGTPSTVVDDLTEALTSGIDELTRPVDAIKHQAKTVTVGISRSEDALMASDLAQAVLAAGASRDRLSYRTLSTLAALDPAVASVDGHTSYRIEGDLADAATVHVVDKGGIAAGMTSRTETDPQSALRGTKHRAATQRQVTVARGRSDGRTVVIVPEIKDNQVVGLTLLHVTFAGTLDPTTSRAVLEGYQGRYAALTDAVTETEPSLRDEVLGTIPIVDLLTEPVHVLADLWRPGV
ncbi:MAG: SIS domain-containing protein [Acidimicrobiales bacterium]